MALELQPITQREAFDFIERHHRHHLPPVGSLFQIAVNDGLNVVGVIVVGRPVSRHLDNGYTAEITRCCTDGTKNAASMLYAAAQRAARAYGLSARDYLHAGNGTGNITEGGWLEGTVCHTRKVVEQRQPPACGQTPARTEDAVGSAISKSLPRRLF